MAGIIKRIFYYPALEKELNQCNKEIQSLKWSNRKLEAKLKVLTKEKRK